jgi:hypothetical protein
MRRVLIILLFLGVGLPGPAVHAAECVFTDLQGVWMIYGQVIRPTERGWARCRLLIEGSGMVTPGTACRDSLGNRGLVDGGHLRINRACTIRGSFEVQYPNSPLLTATIEHARMVESKEVFMGVGFDNLAGTFQIDGVKE